MTYRTIAVFSASGRPGQAQVRQLIEAGFTVRAITRNRIEAFDAIEVVAADLNDGASLLRGCEGMDAVFFTSPTFTERAKGEEQAARLGDAARRAGVKRLIYNTTSWHPEELTGVPTMDEQFRRTDALRRSGVPLTVVRPSLFMDNLLTRWVKPQLLRDGVWAYPHRADLLVSWICLDDVAQAMIATLDSEDWLSRTIDIGGPEALMPPEVCDLLSTTLGRSVVYEQISPDEFGRRINDLFRDVVGEPGSRTADDLGDHYRFKNRENPFYVPVSDDIRRLGIRFTPMAKWLAQQDWSERAAQVGSVSG